MKRNNTIVIRTCPGPRNNPRILALVQDKTVAADHLPEFGAGNLLVAGVERNHGGRQAVVVERAVILQDTKAGALDVGVVEGEGRVDEVSGAVCAGLVGFRDAQGRVRQLDGQLLLRQG